MNDFAQWMNLMLSIEVFQSYSSIVTPNEFAPNPSDGDAKHDIAECKNYQFFMRKYMKGFLKTYNAKDEDSDDGLFIPKVEFSDCDIPGSIFQSQDSSSQTRLMDTFELGSTGQTVKIDFEKPKQKSSSELQQSCLQLIDQLAFYYNNFNHQIQFKQVVKSLHFQKDYYEKISSCMIKTKEFLNIFQTNNEQYIFNQEQEVLLRDLIE
jgi:hypothetical protein